MRFMAVVGFVLTSIPVVSDVALYPVASGEVALMYSDVVGQLVTVVGAVVGQVVSFSSVVGSEMVRVSWERGMTL